MVEYLQVADILYYTKEIIIKQKMSNKGKDKSQESSSSKTIHIIAWIATMILILGIPTAQITWYIVVTLAERDRISDKECEPRAGVKTGNSWDQSSTRSCSLP